MPHKRIQSETGPIQNVRSGLQDQFPGVGMDPVDFDAAARFVHDFDGPFDGAAPGPGGNDKEEDGEKGCGWGFHFFWGGAGDDVALFG
mmetsp:Transcript_18023/g.37602  ORF Transcript_18023/g.37602 Transcript_18023/m.37602 type:complete len:88 (+) Transcript_18023:1245-1508(+)